MSTSSEGVHDLIESNQGNPEDSPAALNTTVRWVQWRSDGSHCRLSQRDAHFGPQTSESSALHLRPVLEMRPAAFASSLEKTITGALPGLASSDHPTAEVLATHTYREHHTPPSVSLMQPQFRHPHIASHPLSMFDPTNLVPAAKPAGARISIVLIGEHLQLIAQRVWN
jgi:hypothetical protein